MNESGEELAAVMEVDQKYMIFHGVDNIVAAGGGSETIT